MVAVVSGNGLGLGTSSLSSLGNQGAVGNASEGQAGEQVYVNSTTGNLVIQEQADYLAALGVDLPLVQTYNSQGQLTDPNNDNWRLGVNEQLQTLTGTVNTAGSTITKVFGDDSQVIYQYDTTQGMYISTNSQGAHDTLTYAAGTQTWTWVNGATQLSEVYDSTGRLLSTHDTSGNPITYGYTNGLLTQITDASGQTTYLDYNGNALSDIRVVSQGVTQTLTHYEYDSQNRLSKVKVDLSPQDNSITDGKIYTTTYTYDGTSTRILGISHSDGTSVSFTYEQTGGVYRVKTYSTTPTGPVTASANTTVLSTTVVQTTTTTDKLSTAATTPDWSNVSPIPGTSGASSAREAFDGSGNIYAIWTTGSTNSTGGATAYVARYDAASRTWSSALNIGSAVNNIPAIRITTDSQGNAVAAFVGIDSNNYGGSKLLATRYDATTHTWGPVQSLVTTTSYISGEFLDASISGGHAVVGWDSQRPVGPGPQIDYNIARFDNGSWQSPELVASSVANQTTVVNIVDEPTVTIDAQGNVTALYEETNASAFGVGTLYATTRSEATGTWSAPLAIDTNAEWSSYSQDIPKIVTDPNGNSIAVWRDYSGGLTTAHYTRSTNTWSAPTNLGGGNYWSLASDGQGNALLASVSGYNVLAYRYTASTGAWSSPTTLQTIVYPQEYQNITAGLAGGNPTVEWSENADGLWFSEFNGTSWSTAARTTAGGGGGTDDNAIQPLANGDINVFWDYGTQQLNESSYLHNYFYKIPSGATWSSVAQAMYGDGSAGAASALQTAMGNPPLTAGNDLGGFPTTLSYQTSTTLTVAPYYTVAAGDTWASITQAIYRTTDTNAIAALQSALGDPASLPVGQHLTVPLSLGYTSASTGQTTTLTYTTSTPSSVTAGANSASLISTQTNTTTSTANLNSSAITTPVNGWTGPTSLASSAVGRASTQFDPNGNGFTAYFDGGNLYVRRFDAASQTWGSAVLISSASEPASSDPIYAPALAIDSQGDAVLSWVHSTSVADSVNAAYYNVSTGAWSPAQQLRNLSGRVTPTLDGATVVQVALNGNNAAAVWVEPDGNGGNNVWTARLSGGVWQAPELLGATDPAGAGTAAGVEAPSLSFDIGSDIVVGWRTGLNGSSGLYNNNFFNGATGTWTGSFSVANVAATGVSTETLIDQYGYLALIYDDSQGVHVMVSPPDGSSYTVAYTVGDPGTTITGHKLIQDSQGNYVGAWTEWDGTSTSVHVVNLNGQTGAMTTQLMGSGPGIVPGSLSVAGQGGQAAVAWMDSSQGSPPAATSYVSRYDGTTWSVPAVVNGSDTLAAYPSIGFEPNGNVSVAYYNGTGIQTNTYTGATVPYYTVLSGDTWSSIATAVYGTANAAQALQTALSNPALTAGTHLTNLPSSLSYTTTTTTSVTPYYLVNSGDTWTSITQAVYGTTDSAAIAALQAALGTPALTAGTHLTVPATLTYTPSTSGSVVSTQTDIQSALGEVTSLIHDAQGRLTKVSGPAVNGIRQETDYQYDTFGNVTSVIQDPAGLNRTTVYQYDSNGNRVYERDADGNTVSRVYSATDQLLSQTQYTVPDPDGAGNAQPSGPLTTRYVYDSHQRLRFTVSALGDVTEYQYNASGERTSALVYDGGVYDVSSLTPTTTLTESQLSTWAASQDLTKLKRTDYTYDFRGELSTQTAYGSTDSTGAGISSTASVTHYVYDQRGKLLQTVDPRGSTTGSGAPFSTTYTYDGLGRLLTTTAWVSSSQSQSTVTQYDDANNRSVTTSANGLITTRSYDAAGELISVIKTDSTGNTLSSTSYSYDRDGRLRMVTDALGQRTYIVYDAAGRKAGTIDADGALTQYVYDGAGELVKTVEYADLLPASAIASLIDAQGQPTTVTVDSLVSSLASVPGRNAANDRITRSVYDSAGQLVYTIDPAGDVTQNFYDGEGRLTDQVQYATPITVASSVGALSPDTVHQAVHTSPDDRHTRHFYDADGNLIGTLDAGGYLVEFQYDAAGQLAEQIAYAKQTSEALWTSGTLDQLRPAADSVNDITSHFFYDGEGRRAGVLDGEGYLTETVYDAAGNVSAVNRYDQQLTYSSGATLSSLKTAIASTTTVHTTSYQYDGTGKVTTQTNYEGTITAYGYDSVGELNSTTLAQGTSDQRVTQERYDLLGRVIAELTPQGSSLITAGMTKPQIDAIWAQYSVQYTYDQAGRRTSSTDQNGYQTLYYYDTDGRLTYTVNGAGEVTQTNYNALGEVTDTIAYANRISVTSLTGGAVSTVLTSRVTAAADPTKDSHSIYTYKLTGKVATSTTTAGASTTYGYDAFGDVSSTIQQIDSATTLRHDYKFDARGLLTLTQWDTTGLDTTENDQYDAFRRLTSVTDSRQSTKYIYYDRLGRQVQTIDANGAATKTTYDAFSRVLTIQDALQQTTTFQYYDATLSQTTTTPEGIVITTVHNREGQKLNVTSAGLTTTYSYDPNGQLQGVSDNLGTLDTRTYDAAGREVTDTDARGVTTKLTYDAANRVLTRTVDSNPGGLNLLTSYTYDGEGRITKVVDPTGKVTTTKYDQDGRVLQVDVDPTGIDQRTNYTYDDLGHVLTVVEGAGSAAIRRTQYIYDALGRRTEEIDDPISLGGTYDLKTYYKYDANGNLTRKIDAAGNSTWYVYDADNRLRYTVDALGGVTETTYDADGRTVGARRYATPVSTAALGDVVQSLSVTATSADRFDQTVYDKDGRAVYSINSLGVVTERQFDDRGDVTRLRTYSDPIPAGVYSSIADVRAALGRIRSNVDAIGTSDEVKWTDYDLRGQALFTVDGVGDVVENTYDNGGKLTSTTAFATKISAGSPTDLASLQSWATANANSTADRTTRYWYDSTGRLRFTFNAEGYLQETRYDDAGRTQTAIDYVSKITLASTATLADVTAAAAAMSVGNPQTVTQFDALGRVSTITDAAGGIESYGYDAVGNKTSYIDKNGATWTYEYDTDGRLSHEIGPPVAVTTVTADGSGNFSTPTTSNIRLDTAYTYDVLGHVKTRTEASNTSQPRTITYDYDALGRQTRITYDSVGVYNFAADNPALTGTSVTRTETTPPLYTEVAYDTLGNAYRSRDQAGNYSYKTYDAAGHLTYEVDADNYVTGYSYDAFGNRTGITRYANTLTSAVSTSSSDVTNSDVAGRLSLAPSEDRTITTGYDALNRVISVKQPAALAVITNMDAADGTPSMASATTLTEYNAFGQVSRSRTLVDANAGTYADTYFYYDRLGEKTGEVDPLGYLTTYRYDYAGNVLQKSEYSRALAAGSWNATTYGTPVSSTSDDPSGDRITSYTYDALNRKTSESIGVQYTLFSQGVYTPASGDKVTSYAYDADGNVTAVSTDGQIGDAFTTYTWYDALGRVIAVASPRSNLDGSLNSSGVPVTNNFTPLTELRRDAFGDLVEQIRRATDAGVIVASSTPPVVGDSSNDRNTLVLYDKLGHAIETQDPTGAKSFASYDANGKLAKEWQYVTNNDGTTEALVTIHRYDNLGREIATIQPQVSGSVVTYTNAEYNAFGEITHKGVYGSAAGGPWQEYFDYDQAGHLWRTNSGDEVDKVYLYNLTGQATVEIRSQTQSLAGYSSASDVNNLSGTLRTQTVYNLDGQVVQKRDPQFQVVSTQDLIDGQPTINTMATPVPPDAIWQAITFTGTTYTLGYTQTIFVGAPVAYSAGGGYVQVSPPTASNPDGVYTRVDEASYSLGQAKQFYWAAPPALNTVATFEYWPLSNPSAVTSAAVHQVVQGAIGVNISSLSGQYGYRISYTHPGASSAFATQTGTFDTASGAVAVTSSSSVAPEQVTPTTTQVLDRWGEVVSVQDAGGGVTQHHYNTLGKLTDTLLPQMSLLDTRYSIVSEVTRPMTSNLYDLQGNLIATKDGNGAGMTATFNSAGQQLTQSDPDSGAYTNGAITRTTYDAFGDAIQVTDQLGYRTRNVYDKDGRLLQSVKEIQLGSFTSSDPTNLSVNDPANVETQAYAYDADGRRLTETNGAGEVTSYWYDLQGHVLRSVTPMGSTTSYQYDLRGNKTRETDGDGSYQTWNYDSNGRLTGHTDLTNSDTADYGTAGASYVYGYDDAGEVTSQTSSFGQDLVYAHDGAGHVTTITDTGTGGSGMAASSGLTTYVYDAAGRVARETVVVDGRTHQDTRIGYDALGRIQTLDDPDYRLTYSYDAAGNRTLISTDYLDHNGNFQQQNLYYRYDENNHVIISQGVATTGAVPDITINANQGAILTYDAKGERTSVQTKGTRFDTNEYSTNGTIVHTDVIEITPTNGLATQYYAYDGLGQLTQVSKETDLSIFDTATGNSIGGGWTSTVINTRQYDKAGRVLNETNYLDENNALSNQSVVSTYDHDGRATSQTTRKNGSLESVVTYGSSSILSPGQWSLGYDAANVLRGYRVDVYTDGTYDYTTTYNDSYRMAGAYLQTGETANSVGTNAPQAGSTTRTYNDNGALIQFTDNANQANNRYFANNVAGQALTTVQGQFDGAPGDLSLSDAWGLALNRNTSPSNYAPKAQYFFFANGNYVGSFGQLQNPDGTFAANFDVNYTPISKDYPTHAPQQVVVQKGDTLRTVAARVYGDASLWYVIADKNGLTDPNAALTPGTTLIIPNAVVSLSNTGSSFKPFSVSEALGDTTPTQPPPPMAQSGGGGGCGGLGQVLLIVVAIVVTVYTAGAAAEAFGAVAGAGETAAGVGASVLSGSAVAGLSTGAAIASAAIGGAVGALVSQGIAIATGAQDGFDWTGVALGAIGAGVTAGLGEIGVGTVLAPLGKYGAIAAEAAISNAATQGIEVATGLQSSFNWHDVAVSAVAAPAAAAAAVEVNDATDSAFAGKAAGGIAGSGVRAALGGNWNTATALSDAFGHALGDSVIESQTTGPSALSLQQQQLNDVEARIASQTQASVDAFNTQLGLDTSTQLQEQQVTDQVASDNQAYFDQAQASFANAQQLRILSNDSQLSIGSSLDQSFQSTMAGLTVPQVNYPEDAPVDPVTAAEYQARGQGTIDFMAAQTNAIANGAPAGVDLSGIRRYNQGSLPNSIGSVTDMPTVGGYQIVANMPVNNGVAGTSPTYYTAYNTTLGTTDYVIGPNDLQDFLKNHISYEAQANLSRAPAYVQQTVAYQTSLLNGDFSDAGSHFLKSYAAAATDPGWLLQMGTGIVGGMMAAPAAIGESAAEGAVLEPVLFGQRRVSPMFSSVDANGNGPPPYLAGRSLQAVASDLRSGALTPDQLPINAFYTEDGQLVSANTRSLTALSLAGMRPTNVTIVQPTATLLSRLSETPLLPRLTLPGPVVPITPSMSNLRILKLVQIPQ